MARARLDLIYALDRAQIERVGGESVKGIGRHAEHLSGLDLLGGVSDQRRFGAVAINLEDLGAHGVPQREVGEKVTYHREDGSWHRAHGAWLMAHGLNRLMIVGKGQ